MKNIINIRLFLISILVFQSKIAAAWTPLPPCSSITLCSQSNNNNNPIEKNTRPLASSGNDAITEVTRETCFRLGVQPLKSYRLTRWDLFLFANLRKFRRYVWIPLLHGVDRLRFRIPNASLNLEVLWWKAMAEQQQSNHTNSQVRWAYDLLPPVVRRIIHWPLFRWLFSHRACKAVELRSVYMDSIICQEVPKLLGTSSQKRLVSLGAGYDIKSIRWNHRVLNQTSHGSSEFTGLHQAIELDLEPVIQAKKWLIQHRLLSRQSTKEHASDLQKVVSNDKEDLQWIPVDLNQNVTDGSLKQTLLQQCTKDKEPWCNVFVLEAILMYLDEDIPFRLLQLLAQSAQETGQPAIVIFADSLLPRQTKRPNSIEHLRHQARGFLKEAGWELQEYLPVRGYELGWATLF